MSADVAPLAPLKVAPDAPGETGAGRRIAEMIRVDHAGEYGAVQIYRGQLAVFSRLPGKAHIAGLIAEMEAGEKTHLETFDRLIRERGVRPTALAPIWRGAGFMLGAATALMGEKAAHACTAAVEEAIEEHYHAQSKALDGVDSELKTIVDQFREDELAHRDTAIVEGAKSAPGFGVLSGAIKLGCKLAIKISEKV
jgi:ubiquinone biosynthesis monooxygenase Coq7